jgi:hypothetical protein
VFMSLRYDVGFCDASHILGGDDVVWNLFMFILYVMNNYSCIFIVCSVCISS